VNGAKSEILSLNLNLKILKIGNRAHSVPDIGGLASLVVRKDGQVRVVISIDSIMRSFAVHMCR